MFNNPVRHKEKRRRLPLGDSDQEAPETVIQECILSSSRPHKGIVSATANSLTSDKDSKIETNIRESSSQILSGIDAFRQSGVDAGVTEDAKAQYGRSREIQKKIDSGELEEGVYRGQKGYRAYAQPDDERKASSAKFTGAYGPNRLMANVRTTSRFDYQMDICKDYKDSGYCGFGDSCKFLHDRSVVKSGWEIDREWDIEQAAAKRLIEELQVEEELLICVLCKKEESLCKSSVCSHIFCESCFLKQSIQNCPICKTATKGIFVPLQS